MSNPHEVKTVRCAHCGAVRQEANHWFVATVKAGVFKCSPLLVVQLGVPEPVLRKLRRGDEPVCGQQCAQKVFEQYLAQGISRRVRA